MRTDPGNEPTQWIIHGERVVDDTRRARWSIASVELPDGVLFKQYVLRAPRSAMAVVLDNEDRVLMMWRHRFIIDWWVWKLPGGYVDDGEDPEVAAAREVEEATGWRPLAVEPLTSFQPMVGTADAENLLFLAHGAEYVGTPADINEAAAVEWIALDSVRARITRGEIVGSASVIGLLTARLGRSPAPSYGCKIAIGLILPGSSSSRLRSARICQHPSHAASQAVRPSRRRTQASAHR